MSDLRQAAQQALEALEYGQHSLKQISEHQWESRGQLAMDALRAALAQKHDPVAHSGWVLREVLFDNGEPIGHREPQHSPAALAQQAEQQPMHPELQKMWEDHIDKCFRAIPVPEQAEPVQMHPSDFAKLIKGKEAMTGIPVYWAEWPSKEES